MAAMNKVFLLGNLGRDVEVRHMPDGRAVANVNMATTEVWRDQDGDRKKHTEWHRLNFYGRQAEVASQFLRKGSQLFVEGMLRTREWTDKEGNKRSTTEVRVTNFQMLDRREDSGRDDRRPRDSDDEDRSATKSSSGDSTSFHDAEEDIPW